MVELHKDILITIFIFKVQLTLFHKNVKDEECFAMRCFVAKVILPQMILVNSSYFMSRNIFIYMFVT